MDNKKAFYRNMNHYIFESSLQRVINHIKRGFFIVSADRGDRTPEQNQKAQENLLQDLKTCKLGYIPLYGGFIEDLGLPTERNVDNEVSFLVPYPNNYNKDLYIDVALQLMEDYNQDSILYADPNEVILYIYKDGRVLEVGSGLSLGNIEFYYSRLKKGSHNKLPFVFEGVIIPTKNMRNIVMEKASGHLGLK